MRAPHATVRGATGVLHSLDSCPLIARKHYDHRNDFCRWLHRQGNHKGTNRFEVGLAVVGPEGREGPEGPVKA